jgi:hypothetical protein
MTAQKQIERKRARAFHQDAEAECDHQQVVLKSLTFLSTGPVHEETDFAVNQRNGDDHIAKDSQRGDPRQEADNETEATKKFRNNGDKRQRRRDTRPDKHLHCSLEAVAAEPAQQFLCPMGEKDDAENQSRYGENPMVFRVNQFEEHDPSAPFESVEIQRHDSWHRNDPTLMKTQLMCQEARIDLRFEW